MVGESHYKCHTWVASSTQVLKYGCVQHYSLSNTYSFRQHGFKDRDMTRSDVRTARHRSLPGNAKSVRRKMRIPRLA